MEGPGFIAQSLGRRRMACDVTFRNLAALFACLFAQMGHACEVGAPSSKLISTSLELTGADREAVLYAALVQVWPDGLDEGLAGPLLRQNVIPSALNAAAGDPKALQSQLQNRLDGLCTALVGTGNGATVGEKKSPQKDEPPVAPKSVLAIHEAARNTRIAARLNAQDESIVLPEITDRPPLVASPTPDSPPTTKETHATCSLDALTPRRNTSNYPGQTVEAMTLCAREAEATWSRLSKREQDATKPQLESLRSRAAQLNAHSGVFIGPRYTLSSDGSFKGGGELLAFFNSEVTDGGHAGCRLPNLSWCRGFAELNYSRRDLGEETAGADFNPFKQTGGVLRADLGYKFHWSDWFGVAVGAGLTTPQDVRPESRVRTRPRYFAGANMETFFVSDQGSQLGLGQLFTGVAYDRFWTQCVERSEPPAEGELGECTARDRSNWRWIVDARYLLPKTQVGDWRIGARAWIDKPLNSRGESDVAFGFYLFNDFGKWLSGYAPKEPKE